MVVDDANESNDDVMKVTEKSNRESELDLSEQKEKKNRTNIFLS